MLRHGRALLTGVFLFLGSAGFALADDCTTKTTDLEKLDGTWARDDRYDQGIAPVCYAYTATLLTEHFLKYDATTAGAAPTTEEIHPLWMAYLNTRPKNVGEKVTDENFRAGNAAYTIERLRTYGTCDSDYIESVLKKEATNRNEFMKVFDEIEAAIESKKNAPEKFGTWIEQCAGNMAFFPMIDDLRNSIGNLDTRQFTIDLAMREFFPKCFDGTAIRKTRTSKIPVATRANRFDPTRPKPLDALPPGELMNELIQANIEDGYPVGLAFCANALKTKTKPASAISEWFDSKTGNWLPGMGSKENCKGHSVVALGRAMIGGECKILMRQSYGDELFSDHCLCRTKDSRSTEKCATGETAEAGRLVGCYVSAKRLVSSTYAVEWIDRKNEPPLLSEAWLKSRNPSSAGR